MKKKMKKTSVGDSGNPGHAGAFAHGQIVHIRARVVTAATDHAVTRVPVQRRRLRYGGLWRGRVMWDADLRVHGLLSLGRHVEVERVLVVVAHDIVVGERIRRTHDVNSLVLVVLYIINYI